MRGASLNDFNDIKPGHWYPYWCPGKWSLHQLLEKLISITGPAHATIVSYTVSEEAIRTIFKLSSENKLTFSLLVDHSAFRHKKGLIMFACNCKNSKIYTINTHAKLIIIQNDKWSISVITSANLTPNARCESGMICTVPEIAIEYTSALLDIIKDSSLLKFTDYGPG